MLHTALRSRGGSASSRPATLAGWVPRRILPTRLSLPRAKAWRTASSWFGAAASPGSMAASSLLSPASWARSAGLRCDSTRSSIGASICCHSASRCSGASRSSSAATLAGCMRCTSLRTRLFRPSSRAWTMCSLPVRLACPVSAAASVSGGVMVGSDCGAGWPGGEGAVSAACDRNGHGQRLRAAIAVSGGAALLLTGDGVDQPAASYPPDTGSRSTRKSSRRRTAGTSARRGGKTACTMPGDGPQPGRTSTSRPACRSARHR